MDSMVPNQLRSASQDVRNAVAAAAKSLPPIERFELMIGARYGMEEQAGTAPPLDDREREVLGRYFTRGRDLVVGDVAKH